MDLLGGTIHTLFRREIVVAILVLLVILVIVLPLVLSKKESFAKVRGGDNVYMVHEDLENPQLAAETMDKLNSIATTIIDRVYKKYVEGDSINNIKDEYKKTVINGAKSLKKKFKSANMQENIPERSGGDTSYVINKGDVFAMCLRDPKDGNKIDNTTNTLTFVLIHELSHIFSATFGHDDVFWNNFRFLLQEAVEMGIYNKVDYRETASPYCGIIVTYSPLYDARLVNYRK